MKIDINKNLIKGILFLFILLLPFWRLGSLISFLTILVLSIVKQHKKLNILSNNFFLPLIFYHLILLLFRGSFSDDFDYYKTLLLLVLIPVAFNYLKKEWILKSVQVYIISVFLLHIAIIYNLISYFIINNKAPILRSTANVNEMLKFSRPSVGFLSITAILFSILFFIKRRNKIYLFFILTSTILIFYISARLAILLLMLFIIVFGFVLLKNKLYKKIYLITTLLGLFIFVGFGNSTLNHRFIQIKDDSRIIIWKNALKIIKENKLYIFGTNKRGDVIDELKEKFKTDTNITYLPIRKRFLSSSYTTHNQFLDELVIGGFMGLILMSFPFLWLLYKSIKQKNPYSILLLITMLAFLFVENVFERQMSVFLFGYFIIILQRDILSKKTVNKFYFNIHLSNFKKPILFGILLIVSFILFKTTKSNYNNNKKKINEIDFVLNEKYKIGDVRRYGVFPNKPAGRHPVNKKMKMQVIFDIAESGIEINFPKGFYKTAININERENMILNFNDCTFYNIIQIKGQKNHKSRNIIFNGELATLVKFYTKNSDNITIEKLTIKSDTLKSINRQRSFGASIYRLTSNLEINELIIEDLGSDNKNYRFSRAAVEIHGLNDEPENITINTLWVKSSDRTGVYISGEDININSIIIDKFGIGSKVNLLPVEGGIKGEESEFSGVWLNKCYNSNIGKIELNLKESKGDFGVNFDFGQTFRPVIIDSLIVNNTNKSKIVILNKSKHNGVKLKNLIIND